MSINRPVTSQDRFPTINLKDDEDQRGTTEKSVQLRALFERYLPITKNALLAYLIETHEEQLVSIIEHLSPGEKQLLQISLCKQFQSQAIHYIPELMLEQMGETSELPLLLVLSRLNNPDLKDLNESILNYTDADRFLDSINQIIQNRLENSRVLQKEGKNLFLLTTKAISADAITQITTDAQDSLKTLIQKQSTPSTPKVSILFEQANITSTGDLEKLPLLKHQLTTKAKLHDVLGIRTETPFTKSQEIIFQTFEDLLQLSKDLGIEEVLFPHLQEPNRKLMLEIGTITLLRKNKITQAGFLKFINKLLSNKNSKVRLTAEQAQTLQAKIKTYLNYLNILETNPAFSHKDKENHFRQLEARRKQLRGEVEFTSILPLLKKHYKASDQMEAVSPFGHLYNYVKQAFAAEKGNFYQICFDVIGVGARNYQHLMQTASQLYQTRKNLPSEEIIQNLYLESIAKVNDDLFLSIAIIQKILGKYGDISLELSTGDEGEIILHASQDSNITLAKIKTILNEFNHLTPIHSQDTNFIPFRIRASAVQRTIGSFTLTETDESIPPEEILHKLSKELLREIFSTRLRLLEAIEMQKNTPNTPRIQTLE